MIKTLVKKNSREQWRKQGTVQVKGRKSAAWNPEVLVSKSEHACHHKLKAPPSKKDPVLKQMTLKWGFNSYVSIDAEICIIECHSDTRPVCSSGWRVMTPSLLYGTAFLTSPSVCDKAPHKTRRGCLKGNRRKEEGTWTMFGGHRGDTEDRRWERRKDRGHLCWDPSQGSRTLHVLPNEELKLRKVILKSMQCIFLWR